MSNARMQSLKDKLSTLSSKKIAMDENHDEVAAAEENTVAPTETEKAEAAPEEAVVEKETEESAL